MLKKGSFLTLFLMLIMFSSVGFAIEQYGVLTGKVTDEQGVGLPSVEVTVKGPTLMGSRATLTNAAGDFRVTRLPVGKNYVASLKLEGFKEVVRKNVRIELGKETIIGIVMEMGVITERIEVTGEIPVMDPKTSTNQVNVSHELIETLANDRQYQTIMEMMPGAIPGNNPYMMGGTSSDNMYQFDGMESTDPQTKTWSGSANFDNFEEMQVVAQGAPAEYGRGTGAVINVVTKSGSNKLHGTARLSITKSDWNAQPTDQNTSFSDATHYLNETRPAINLGGPIIKDHIWFFGSYERRNKWKPATWYMNPSEAVAASPSGAGKGYYQGHYASVKLTVNMGIFSIMGMWMEDPITMPQYYKYVNSASVANENELTKTQGGYNINFESTITLGANTYAVARFSMKRNDLNLYSHEMTGPRYYQGGYYWGAGYYDYTSSRDHNQFILNVNHFADTSFGFHDIKIGAELYDINLGNPINYSYPGGEYIYYQPDGTPRYRYVYETPDTKQANIYNDVLTLFIQDKWEVTRGLTLNLGLRVEKSTYKNHAKETVMEHGFGDTLAPRLGVAYAFGDNKFHANWGRFFDIYTQWLIKNFQPDIFSRTRDYYRGEYYGLPTWTYIGTYWATAPAGETTKDDDIGPTYMDEFGIGYERILGNKFSVSLSYMHRAWKDKIEDYDLDGDEVWHFANETEFYDPAQDINWGKTFKKYDAIMLVLKKNLGDDKFQFMASYTWSKLKSFTNSDGEDTWGDHPYADVNRVGYNWNDVRHMVKFYGNFLLPFDINLGINMAWYSGKPYSDLGETDERSDYVYMYYEDGTGSVHDGDYHKYMIYPKGTAGRFPATWSLDVRLEKKIRIKKICTLSAYIDVFNILNQQGPIDRNCYVGDAYLTGPVGGDYALEWNNPSFANFDDFYAPMSFFIGAKVEW